MERNGGKWRGDNGITVRIGGYKNLGIGWVIESILKALETNRHKTGGRCSVG